ncbi:MAG: hypothetical protein R2751_11430 [Bacteroidales bacterium]
MNVGEVANSGIEAYVNTVNVSRANFQLEHHPQLQCHPKRSTGSGSGRSDCHRKRIAATGNTAIIMRASPWPLTDMRWTASSRRATKNPGYPNFADQDGDGIINTNDATIIGDPFPRFHLRDQQRGEIQELDLQHLPSGMKGGDLLNVNVIESMYPSNFRRNRLVTMMDRWTPTNTDAKWPSSTDPNSYPGGTNGKVNTRGAQDASYLRLKTLQLSYDVPVSNVGFLSLLRVYATGRTCSPPTTSGSTRKPTPLAGAM